MESFPKSDPKQSTYQHPDPNIPSSTKSSSSNIRVSISSISSRSTDEIRSPISLSSPSTTTSVFHLARRTTRKLREIEAFERIEEDLERKSQPASPSPSTRTI